MMLVRSLLFIPFFILSTSCFSQFKFEYNDSIKVKLGNDTLKYPWAGGLNYIQFSDIDFDFDGDMDLFIFDRSKDNIRLFETVTVNGVKDYKFVPNAARFFPSDLKNRAALLDYDGDGKNDIFTYGIGGTKVYKNIGDAVNGLQWKLISNILYSDYAGSYTNLYISSSDIPAYIDVDGDSDLDILTFNIGGERIEYHQNQSMELYGHNDSLKFVLKNECWGKFKEDPNNNNLLLNDQTSPCSVPNIPNPQRPEMTGTLPEHEIENLVNPRRHAGSTILALDVDNSGVLDLVIGDVSHDNMILVVNGGTAPNTNSAMISQDVNFPSNTTPAALSLFPAAFYVDVDHDGKKDLIVGANAKGVSQNEKSVLYYKNLGVNNLPNFQLKSKSFLQEEMIETGTGSIPVFFDQNNDGKEDLIIGNFYRYKEPILKESALVNYRNTGTATEPFFTFVDLNYLNIIAQNYGLRSVPAFGDIDADGDKDLILGLENGTLVFYKNIAAAGAPANFATPVLNYTDQAGAIITAGSYCFPQLFDLDNDGLIDLILGKKTGELMYYRNTGTPTAPTFTLVTDMLGGIDISPTTPEGYAAPHFFRWNDTTNLFLGGIDGKLHFYNDIDSHLQSGDLFNLVSPAYLGINVEGYSAFYVNDIDNDGKLNLFVGGDLGGVMHYEHNPNSVLSVAEQGIKTNVSVYPNPSESVFFIDIETGNETDWKKEVYDMTGRLIPVELNQNTVNLQDNKNGLYHLVLTNKLTGEMVCRKLIKK